MDIDIDIDMESVGDGMCVSCRPVDHDPVESAALVTVGLGVEPNTRHGSIGAVVISGPTGDADEAGGGRLCCHQGFCGSICCGAPYGWTTSTILGGGGSSG